MAVVEDKYQSIIEKAFPIFMQNGIRNVSMDDLCREMGISKKTLYKYVSNKADLLEKISEHMHSIINSRIKKIKCDELNAIDVLLEMSKISAENHHRINPIVNFEIRKYYPEVFKNNLNKKKELIVSSIISNLEKGINEGLYRQDLNKEIVAHLYFKKVEEFHLIECEDFSSFSYSKVFEVMFENHIRGISNQKGIEYFEKQKTKLNFNI